MIPSTHCSRCWVFTIARNFQFTMRLRTSRRVICPYRVLSMKIRMRPWLRTFQQRRPCKNRTRSLSLEASFSSFEGLCRQPRAAALVFGSRLVGLEAQQTVEQHASGGLHRRTRPRFSLIMHVNLRIRVHVPTRHGNRSA